MAGLTLKQERGRSFRLAARSDALVHARGAPLRDLSNEWSVEAARRECRADELRAAGQDVEAGRQDRRAAYVRSWSAHAERLAIEAVTI